MSAVFFYFEGMRYSDRNSDPQQSDQQKFILTAWRLWVQRPTLLINLEVMIPHSTTRLFWKYTHYREHTVAFNNFISLVFFRKGSWNQIFDLTCIRTFMNLCQLFLSFYFNSFQCIFLTFVYMYVDIKTAPVVWLKYAYFILLFSIAFAIIQQFVGFASQVSWRNWNRMISYWVLTQRSDIDSCANRFVLLCTV